VRNLNLALSVMLPHYGSIMARIKSSLIRLLRSRAHRRMVSELPGYDAHETGELPRL
jgi:hypothetical protein